MNKIISSTMFPESHSFHLYFPHIISNLRKRALLDTSTVMIEVPNFALTLL